MTVGGTRAFNQPDDVSLVLHLLNGVPPSAGGPDQPLNEDGFCGPVTVRAIVKISSVQVWPFVPPGPDTIFPNSALHNALCFYSSNAGLMANPYTP
jgi:hypothetical protein